MEVLITGGSGFIGSRLAKALLSRGTGVKILDKQTTHDLADYTIQGDIRNGSVTGAAAANCDMIYHLAAEHRDDITPSSLYHDVNVEGTKRVVEAAELNKCKRIVFTSSVAVYPLSAVAPDETTTPAPFNRYGETKLEAEELIRDWASRDSARSAVILRLCVVFGEGNRGNVFNLLKQIDAGRFIMLGSGANHKSMAYVDNVVSFMVRLECATSGAHIYNYADKPDLTTMQIVSIARDCLGKADAWTSKLTIPKGIALCLGYAADSVARVSRLNLPLSGIRVQKFCANTVVNTEKAIRTGFLADVDLADAIRRTIRNEVASGSLRGGRSSSRSGSPRNVS